MSSGFVTEQEITEARKARQEEWEKVRSADQPIGTQFVLNILLSFVYNYT